MAETLLEMLLRDKDALMKPLRLWMPMWQEISEVIIPRRSDIIVKRQEGDQRERRLFDSTAVSANERLSGSIVATVTPSTFQWFEPLIPGGSSIRVPNAVELYAHEVGADMYRAIQLSNFDIAIQEFMQDLLAFGTSAMFIGDAGKGNIKCRTLNPGEFMIDTDYNGDVYKFIRLMRMTVREMLKTWGEDALSDKIIEALRRGDVKILDMEVELMHWIAQRKEEPLGFPVDNFPIASIYVDLTHKHVVRKSGFHEWPVMVVRWSSTSGERYGRGPGFTALPDVLSLNKAEELSLRAWAKAIEPPILAIHDGILGQPDFRPSRMSYINMEGALSYLEPKTRLDIETVKREDKRRSIWNIYFMDQVQFIPERGKTPPSAEEVRARLNIMLQILGPQLVRLEKEGLSPFLERVFGIRSRAKKLPVVPPEVMAFIERVNAPIQLEFLGPVARAKRQAEASVIDTFVSFVGAGASIFPELPDNVDSDEMLRERSRIDQVPKKLLRTPEAVEEIRAQRAQQAAQAHAMAQAQAAGQTIRDVTPAMQAMEESESA